MFNFFDCYGLIMLYVCIKCLVDCFGIILCNGCFCNFGVVQQVIYVIVGVEYCELDKIGKIFDCIVFDEKILDKGDCGVVRILFGFGLNFVDVYCFFMFVICLLDIDVLGFEGVFVGSDFVVDVGCFCVVFVVLV